MGIKRIVDTDFWTDDKVMMEFSPEDRLFMLYLLTNPHTTQLGVYKILPKQMAFELGYSSDTINVLLDRFENKYGMIIYSADTGEIAVKNFLCHSIIKGGKPVEDCIEREIRQVKNKQLVRIVFTHISQKGNLNQTVSKIVNQYFIDNDFDNDTDNVNDNDNDNDNDVSSSVRMTNRQPYGKTYEEIKEQILVSKGTGEKTCAWCGCKTTLLHKHHYPIPKRMGGKETVDICSNCHNEFHVMEGQIYGDRHSNVTTPTKNNKRFVPPTLEEVTAYVAERNSKVIPQVFIDFYSSKDWMVGKNKMKDWKAACRNAEGWDRWDKMQSNTGRTFPPPTGRTGNVFLSMLDDEM